MKKKVCVLAALALVLFCAVSLAENALSLPKESYELFVNRAVTIRPEARGMGGKPVYEWESDNPAVATVRKGKVTAVAPGTATITCTAAAKDGETLSAQCAVTVIQPISNILAPKKVSLPAGAPYTPQITIEPANATIKDIRWTSSDEAVLRVLPDGTMETVSIGQATLTGRAMDGSKKSVKITVTVPAVYVTQNKVVISEPGSVEFGYAFTKVHGAGVFITDFEGDAVEFQKLDKKDGGLTWLLLVPKKPGNATIMLKSYGRGTTRVRVTVEKAAITQ